MGKPEWKKRIINRLQENTFEELVIGMQDAWDKMLANVISLEEHIKILKKEITVEEYEEMIKEEQQNYPDLIGSVFNYHYIQECFEKGMSPTEFCNDALTIV